jgi:hypothetical protein
MAITGCQLQNVTAARPIGACPRQRVNPPDAARSTGPRSRPPPRTRPGPATWPPAGGGVAGDPAVDQPHGAAGTRRGQIRAVGDLGAPLQQA